MAQMHPDMEALLQAREQTNAQLGPRGDDPVEARRWWNTYADILGQPHPADMHVYDRTIPTAHLDVPVRVYQPAGKSGARPCILYMHGGGFMLGDLDSSDSNAWGYAQETGATVVSVDYRLTPEHPYPAAFEDCYGVLSWLAENPGELGIDASRSPSRETARAACWAPRCRWHRATEAVRTSWRRRWSTPGSDGRRWADRTSSSPRGSGLRPRA